MNEPQNDVSTPCREYLDMATHWTLIDDLLGGTAAMRVAGSRWLPKESREDPQAWQNRLDRSILYGAYADTVDDLCGRPFSRPVTVQGTGRGGPRRLEAMLQNVDGQGSSLTQFAREVFWTLLNRGVTHILVDFPRSPRAEGQRPTLAEENGLLPTFVHIRPEDLIGWRYVTMDRAPVLSMIRWTTTRQADEGRYGASQVDQIRVWTADRWEIHEPTDQGEYVSVDQGEHTFGGIPLVTIYVNRQGFMVGLPPMEPLAWMNLRHWQSYSDQANILRFARTALLFARGLTQEDLDKEIVLGPNRLFRTTSPNAEMRYVEHTGQAIAAGRQDVLDIEERMTVLGLEPLLSRPSGTQTATGQSIDEAKSQSTIQAWIRALEQGLERAMGMAARWTHETLPEDFGIDVFNDFGVSVRAASDIAALIQMRQAGELDRETFLREVKRRALLGEGTDIDEVIARLEAEGPPLGLERGFADDDESDDEGQDD